MKFPNSILVALFTGATPLCLGLHRKLKLAPPGYWVNNQYIVCFHKSVDDAPRKLRSLLPAHNQEAAFTYKYFCNGVALKNIELDHLSILLEDEDVLYVEQDMIATVSGQQSNPPNWGLDRIDQTGLPLDDSYTYPNDGSGVIVFVLDSGILATHQEFAPARVTCEMNFVQGGNCNDENGHGTSMAGIIGGITYGVAKGVTLKSIKVLDKNGNAAYSTIIAGLEYIQQLKEANIASSMVANLSFSGPKSLALNDAVDSLSSAGVIVVAAAGEGNGSACQLSPGSSATAIVVGAMNVDTDRQGQQSDIKRRNSRRTGCVDIFAPGVNINTTSFTSDSAFTTVSGTSVAAAFVSGVAALYLNKNPTWIYSELSVAMENDAIRVDGTLANLLSTFLIVNVQNI